MSTFFHGKVVIVTGSSNGIGRATARLFAQKGAKVTITGRNLETLKETKEQCVSVGAKEQDILEIVGDLESEETAKALIDGTIDKFGRIDVLVNNAGFAPMDQTKKGLDLDIAFFDRTIAVNTRNIIVLVQLAAPHLSKTRGAIVNVSSIAGLPFAMKGNFYYPISKSALDQLTVQLAGTLSEQGIRVNAVNPGLVETDIFRKLGLSEEQTEQAREMTLASFEDSETIPVGRRGIPDDIAKLIVFLSDRSESEFIVGQRIVIDGGSTIKNVLLSKNIF